MSRAGSVLTATLLLVVAACATPFRADVARFNALPQQPAGGTFVVTPADPAKKGSLEFAQYAAIVAQQLQQEGFTPAAAGAPATYTVVLDYGVSPGREKIATRPGFGYGGFHSWRHPYYYHPAYWRYGHAFYDPFWGPWGAYDRPEVYSYTVYTSWLDMDMLRNADGSEVPVFEGRTESVTRSDSLPKLMPYLAEAMFVDFPGRSGETRRVKIETDKNRS